jgi:ribosome biogenesis GTPase
VITDDVEELKHLFPEIEKLSGYCKYTNCAHIKEIDCAVLEAVKNGAIHKSRYNSYKDIYEEVVKNREF